MLIKNNEIDVFVIPYASFIEEHGTACLDKNIAKTYERLTGRENARHICSSIQSGYIFAWESPFPRDVNKDFRFALSLDFSTLREKYEAVA